MTWIGTSAFIVDLSFITIFSPAFVIKLGSSASYLITLKPTSQFQPNATKVGALKEINILQISWK